MINLLDITPWVDKLNLDCPTFEGRIFATIPDDELTIELHQSPCAFVYIPDDDSEENQLGKGKDVTQRMNSRITVEVILRRSASRADQFNTASVAEIRALRTEVMNSLIAWRPDDCIKSIQHSGGRLVKKETKLLRFADTFTTQSMNKSQR